MLTDARHLADGSVVEADLCIAGAGAAGIAIAREWLGSSKRVCLLEGGGEKREDASPGLYAGRCDAPLADEYLTGSRLRYLGGTTNHWLGYCRPLDELDFARRDWVPHSGWPITTATLAPYFRRAFEVCRVPPELGASAPVVADPRCRLVTAPFRVRRTRFREEYRDALVGSRNVDLHLFANVVGVRLHQGGARVESLEVAKPGGSRFTVKARHYVLAMGGIENPRLLLLSDDVHRGGIGNRYDAVGRYFMEHPVFPVASVCVSGEGSPWSRSLPEDEADWHGFAVSADEQRRKRMLNCILAFGEVPRVKDTRKQLLREGAWQAISGFVEARGREPGGVPGKLGGLFTQRFSIRPEQAPNPESRVTLGEETDPFGNRRAHVRWRLSELEYRTARASLEVMAEDAGRFGLGRIRLEPNLRLEAACSPGFHHMGTTRMSDDPARGVVDRDCRVHGVDNLFVAGSSVFPTSGYANPTFTLLALALRLADHLRTLPR